MLELSTRALYGGNETVQLALHDGAPWLVVDAAARAVECVLVVTGDGRCETRPTTPRQAAELLGDTSLGWALTRVRHTAAATVVLEFEWAEGVDRRCALMVVCAPFFF